MWAVVIYENDGSDWSAEICDNEEQAILTKEEVLRDPSYADYKVNIVSKSYWKQFLRVRGYSGYTLYA